MRISSLINTLFVTCMLGITGCSQSLNAPVKYFQFNQKITPSARTSDNTDVQLRILTVNLRGALNNRGIALEVDNNQVTSANYHLWSEAPDIMLTASAHQTLFTQLDTWMVVKGLPVITDTDQQDFYEIEYEIHHFNGDNAGNADISGLWRLYHTTFKNGRTLKEIHYFSELTPLIDDDYKGLVETLEKTWLAVNLNVAEQLKTMQIKVTTP
ncbi:PqiC family protein [Pseudoalteromonas atlantica]|uniref:PqiC family protein n=1 Tax=Pseudoalteromonas atlantica TaxID=288 RepID=UPI0037355BA2